LPKGFYCWTTFGHKFPLEKKFDLIPVLEIKKGNKKILLLTAAARCFC